MGIFNFLDAIFGFFRPMESETHVSETGVEDAEQCSHTVAPQLSEGDDAIIVVYNEGFSYAPVRTSHGLVAPQDDAITEAVGEEYEPSSEPSTQEEVLDDTPERTLVAPQESHDAIIDAIDVDEGLNQPTSQPFEQEAVADAAVIEAIDEASILTPVKPLSQELESDSSTDDDTEVPKADPWDLTTVHTPVKLMSQELDFTNIDIDPPTLTNTDVTIFDPWSEIDSNRTGEFDTTPNTDDKTWAKFSAPKYDPWGPANSDSSSSVHTDEGSFAIARNSSSDISIETVFDPWENHVAWTFEHLDPFGPIMWCNMIKKVKPIVSLEAEALDQVEKAKPSVENFHIDYSQYLKDDCYDEEEDVYYYTNIPDLGPESESETSIVFMWWEKYIVESDAEMVPERKRVLAENNLTDYLPWASLVYDNKAEDMVEEADNFPECREFEKDGPSERRMPPRFIPVYLPPEEVPDFEKEYFYSESSKGSSSSEDDSRVEQGAPENTEEDPFHKPDEHVAAEKEVLHSQMDDGEDYDGGPFGLPSPVESITEPGDLENIEDPLNKPDDPIVEEKEVVDPQEDDDDGSGPFEGLPSLANPMTEPGALEKVSDDPFDNPSEHVDEEELLRTQMDNDCHGGPYETFTLPVDPVNDIGVIEKKGKEAKKSKKLPKWLKFKKPKKHYESLLEEEEKNSEESSSGFVAPWGELGKTEESPPVLDDAQPKKKKSFKKRVVKIITLSKLRKAIRGKTSKD